MSAVPPAVDEGQGAGEIRRAGRTSIAISGVSLVTYGLTIVRATWVARFFGLSPAIDAFYLAIAVPLFLEGLLLGAFQTVFVPEYLRLATADRGAAGALARRSLTGCVLVLGCLAAALAIFAGPVIGVVGGGLTEPARSLSIRFLRLLSLLLVTEGMGQACAALHQARKRYLVPPFASFLALLVSLLWLIARAREGPIVLVESMLAGGVVFLAVTGLPIVGELATRVSSAAAARRLGSGYALVLATFALTGLNPLVDQAFATYLTSGDVGAYGYATRLYDVIWQLMFVGAGTVLLPLLSGQVVSGRIDDVRHTLGATFRSSFLLFAPIVAGIALLGLPLVTLLFERGAFDREASERVWRVWVALSPTLLLAAWGTALNRLLYAVGSRGAVLVASVANLAVNAAGDYLLMRIFGVVGIGLATSLRALVTLVLLWILVPLEWRRVLPLRQEGGEYLRAVLGLLPLCAAGLLLRRLRMSSLEYVAALASLTVLQVVVFRVTNPVWVKQLFRLVRRRPAAELQRAALDSRS